MAAEADAARERVLAARAELAIEVERLEASARAAVDIPSKIKRNPVRAAAAIGGVGFVALGGPRRLFRRAKAAIVGPDQPLLLEFGGGKTFTTLTFEEFMELDRLLATQYEVLYMSKMQRLSHMVAIEDGRFYRATDGSVINMQGNSVVSDLGVASGGGRSEEAHRKATFIYACDRYGNLFLVQNDMKVKNQMGWPSPEAQWQVGLPQRRWVRDSEPGNRSSGNGN